MAQRPDELGSASFTQWLGEICHQNDVKSPKLHFFMIREGYFCREESVRRWMRAASEPPARAVPALLHALEQILPQIDVWAEYDNWLHGRPFLVASRGSEAQDAQDDSQLRGRDSNPQPSGISTLRKRTAEVVLLNSKRRLTDVRPREFQLVEGGLGGLHR